MTLLNAPHFCHSGKTVSTDSRWHPVIVNGEAFLIEPHTLALIKAGTHMESLPKTIDAPVWRSPECFGSCRMLVLNITHACNLRCKYCFVRECGHTSGQMSSDLAIGAVDTIFKDNEARPRIGFFGGEPLLAWPVLCNVVKHAESKFCNPIFSVTTNGTLVTDEIAAFLAEHKFSVILSMDGSPHRHDSLRPYANGKGSYHDCLVALKRLAAAGIRPTLRSTFVKPSDNRDCSVFSLVDELEVLNDFCDEGYADNVSIEPASLTESCCFGDYALSVEDLRSLEPQYMAAAEWFVDRAGSGRKARFHHLVTILERLVNRRPFSSECGAGNGYLTVSPSGEIHACHREKSPVGKFVDGSPVFDNRRNAWLDNRLHSHVRCPECPFRYLCGGGCRQDYLDRSGNVRIPDGLGCELTRIRTAMAIRVLSELGTELCARAGNFKYIGSGE